jgi:hypothetical protein
MTAGQLMESRISRLEHGFDDLNAQMKTMSGRMDRVVDAIGTLKSAIEANKPTSYTTLLSTAIGTSVLVSMIVAAIFFLVDARVGSATIRANDYVNSMTNEGKIYVNLERIRIRLDRLESAIRWTPRIVDSDIAVK